MIRFNAALLLTLAGLASACGSNTANDADAGPGPDRAPSAKCLRYAKAVQAQSARCVPNGLVTPASQLEADEKDIARACEVRRNLPGSGVTDGYLEACSAALDASVCGSKDIVECLVPRGTQPDNAPCSSSDQCATSCIDALSKCGTCAPLIPLGATCGVGPLCGRGAECGGSGVCVAISYGKAGDACDARAARYCGTDLRCNSTTGRCEAVAGEGQPCTTWCAPGLSCDSASKKCVALPKAKPGGDCTAAAQCESGLSCMSGRCVAARWVDPGGPCGDSTTACLGGGYCKSDRTCSAILADGAPCSLIGSDTCQRLSVCFEGKCTPRDADLCR